MAEVVDQKNQQLLLSVIIPVRNEAANILNLIHDLHSQELEDKWFEIIIVDDRSTDDSLELIRKSSDGKKNLIIKENTGTGKKTAVATGIETASGNYIITTDGDCRVKPGWLQSIYKAIISSNADMLIGGVEFTDTGTVINRVLQLEFLSLQSVTEFFARTENPVMCNGANLCFRNPGRDNYLEMVKINIPSGDDIFLMSSFKKMGKRIVWVDDPDNIVETSAPKLFKEFISQRIRWSSKSVAYTDWSIIYLALIIFISNLIILFVAIFSFFIPKLWIVLLFLFVLKSIPDLLLLTGIAVKRGKTGLLWYFLPVQIIYPLYTVLIGTTGILKGLFSSRPDK